MLTWRPTIPKQTTKCKTAYLEFCECARSKLTSSSLIFSCGWASDDSRLRWAPALVLVLSFLWSSLSAIILTFPGDGRWMQRGVTVPTIPHQAYDTINPQPIHCHFCQYSVFITPWIQSMRGTTVRDGLQVICCTKHVAWWDWFNTRKARIITPLLCFLLL